MVADALDQRGRVAPRSVVDVLRGIDDALDHEAHVLALGPGGRVLGSAGPSPGPVVEVARAVAAALTQGPAVPGSSARCILNTAEACVFVYLLGQDLSVILVGPTDWNIALTGRRVERFLADFVDTYLAETVAEAPGDDPGPLPRPVPPAPVVGPLARPAHQTGRAHA